MIPRATLLGFLLLLPASWADDLAERLGHPPGSRMLILHGDDLGKCQAANATAREAFGRGVMRSGSAMVPCPWFPALAAWYGREAEKPDLGVHLTLTAEWRHYRWGPVRPASEVPGLLDPDGYLWREVDDVRRRATAAEVEAEIRAQVERARRLGLEPTHLDSHMGTLFSRPDWFKVYVDVARDLDVVPMVPRLTGERRRALEGTGLAVLVEAYLASLEARGLPLVDRLIESVEGDDYEEKKAFLLARIRDLEPGLTQVILHPAVDGPELAAITGSHRARGLEYELLIDPEIGAAIEREGVVLVTWREIGGAWRAGRKE